MLLTSQVPTGGVGGVAGKEVKRTAAALCQLGASMAHR